MKTKSRKRKKRKITSTIGTDFVPATLLDVFRLLRYRTFACSEARLCLKHEGLMNSATERPYLWLFASLALVGLVVDQASKYVVFAKLYPDDPMRIQTNLEVIPGLFSLQTNYTPHKDPGDLPLSFLRTLSGERIPFVNHGALFGIGSDINLNSLFAGISILAACFIVFWVSRPSVANDRWLSFALGLILAGTLGNLYDRVVFGGVRDFLHCYYQSEAKLHIWPDFNVADCCLVCGAGVLLAHSIFVKDPATEPAKTEPASADATAPIQTTSGTSGA